MDSVVVTFDDGHKEKFECYRPDAGFEDDSLVVTSDCQVVFLAPQHTVRCVQVLRDRQRECGVGDTAPEVSEMKPAVMLATGMPDPGPGYRLIDKAIDVPQEGDEIYLGEDWGWADRGCVDAFDMDYECIYRRRITPEPVCQREAFSGGGSPSPRECGVCGEGPCEKQPAESPDDWVIQDRVPARIGIDWGFFSPVIETSKPLGAWMFKPEVLCEGCSHGHKTEWGDVVNVWCRRKDLPPLPETPSVGDTVVVQMTGDPWNNCKRTVIVKLENGDCVVCKTGEPFGRTYAPSMLRVVPKPEST